MVQGNERILVVDDDAVISEMFAKGLGQTGYRCVIAGSAEDAEQALQQEVFELMLLDIGMPGRSGLTILSELTRRYPDMAIVMVTGHDKLDTAVMAMREGAYDYLTKPVPLGLLLLRVEKALERRALLLENKAYHVGDKAFDEGGLERVSHVGDKAFDEKGLERVSHEVNSRLEQAKRELGVQNSGESARAELSDLAADVESLADIAQGIGIEATQFIRTGENNLDEKLGGGLPRGSLTLIEGSSSTGKSVLCQHLIYGALMAKGGVACYSSEFTFKRLLTQMNSIGLDLTKCPKGAQLTVEPLEEPLPDEDGDPLLAALIQTMESLPGNMEVIIVDAITNLASYSGERSVLGFFSACKRMCGKGKTIIVVAHSATFDERMAVRLRALCDGYLSLRVENVGEKLMNTLEVRKILNAERATGNVIFFEVEPGMGIRVNPFSRARV